MVNLTRIYTRTGDDGSTRLGDNSVARKTDERLAAFADVDEANSTIGMVLAGTGSDLDDDVTALLRRIQNDLFDVGADLSTPHSDDPPYPPLRVTQVYVDALEAACDRYNAELEPLRSFILPGGTPAAASLHVARTVVRRAERSAWAAVERYGAGGDGGDGASGDGASGDRASGDRASGDRASGDRASGDRASGDRASGDRASGDRASGDRASGDRASGDRASGDRASGDRGAGGVNLLAVRYLNRLSDLLFILARRANRAAGDVLWQPGGGR